MADDKRVVRTAGVYGTFVLPGAQEGDDGPTDLEITPHGVEVTFEQWLQIADAAEANAVVVRLDEDFPAELYAARAEKAKEAETPPSTGGQKPATGTEVDGTDTSGAGSRQRRAANGG